MKILSTGNLNGKKSKYEQLKGIVTVTKPDILLITGDLFELDDYNPLFQAEQLFDVKEYLVGYAKHCEYVLYIFGETDIKHLDPIFNSMVVEDANNIICLNHENFTYGNHTFVGLPLVGNTDSHLKDWVRFDNLACDIAREGDYTVDIMYDIHPISDMHKYCEVNRSITEVILEKLHDVDTDYTIMVSHFPPFLHDYIQGDDYVNSLSAFITQIDVLFTGHFLNHDEHNNHYPIVTPIYGGRKSEYRCDIINHGYFKDDLLFNLNIIKDGVMVYNYHPDKHEEDLFEEAKKWRIYNADTDGPETSKDCCP